MHLDVKADPKRQVTAGYPACGSKLLSVLRVYCLVTVGDVGSTFGGEGYIYGSGKDPQRTPNPHPHFCSTPKPNLQTARYHL